jgi:hypothetical protein
MKRGFLHAWPDFRRTSESSCEQPRVVTIAFFFQGFLWDEAKGAGVRRRL